MKRFCSLNLAHRKKLKPAEPPSPSATKLLFLKNLTKNEELLKKQLFKNLNFKTNIKDKKRLKSIFSNPKRKMRFSTNHKRKSPVNRDLNNHIQVTLRNKFQDKYKTLASRVSKWKIFDNEKDVADASKRIPEFHQYFKTNFKKTLFQSKENRRSKDAKRKQVLSKVGKYKQNNPLSSNSQIKDYINHKRMTLAEFTGTQTGTAHQNYSWRNKHLSKDKLMMSEMRQLMKKNNTLRRHKYVSEEDRVKLEQFLILNNHFLEKKKEKRQKAKMVGPIKSPAAIPKVKNKTLSVRNLDRRKEMRLKFYKDSK